jgi:hypothetical protein
MGCKKAETFERICGQVAPLEVRWSLGEDGDGGGKPHKAACGHMRFPRVVCQPRVRLPCSLVGASTLNDDPRPPS